MNKQRKVSFMPVVLVVLATLFSCGAPKDKKAGQTAPVAAGQSGESSRDVDAAQGTASMLGLHIVVVDGDGSQTGSGMSNPIEVRATISDKKVSFDDPIQLMEETLDAVQNHKVVRPFLVWPEKGFGPRIVNASYQHQIQDAANHPRGESKRELVRFDSENRKWFIPLLDLVDNHPENADASESHSLKLELVLENGSTVGIEVVLRMRGPLAPIVSKRLERTLPFSQFEEASKLAQGAILYSEEYTNPSSRPLRLWVRSSGRVMMDTGLDELLSGMPAGRWRYYQSSTGLDVSAVVAESGGKRKPGTAFGGRWVAFELDPQETLRLDWKFTLAPGSERCPLPGLGLAITGVRVQGGWEREVRISDQSCPAAKATVQDLAAGSKLLVAEVVKGTIPMNLIRGEVKGNNPYACQGYF